MIRNQARGNSSGVRIPLFPFSFSRQGCHFPTIKETKTRFLNIQESIFEFEFPSIKETILLNDRNGFSKYKGNSCHLCRVNLQNFGRVFRPFSFVRMICQKDSSTPRRAVMPPLKMRAPIGTLCKNPYSSFSSKTSFQLDGPSDGSDVSG